MNAGEAVSDVWRDLARRHRCDTAPAEATLDDLIRAYAESHRHYHTLSHIADLLQLLQEHGAAVDDDAAKLAILFHDVVYDLARQDNEAASAKLAVGKLTALGLPGPLIAKVESYILATQHSASLQAAGDSDLRLLLDLDLSVLAAPPDRYRAYAEEIRREYAAVPNDLYLVGRRQVLEGFLARPQIYLTERLRASWESPARANLAREIAELV